MKKGGSFQAVGLDDFNSEVIKADRPVLLACIYRGMEFSVHVEELKAISKMFGELLKVCYLNEEDRRILMKMYQISGTPTFLIFHQGKELDRLLGSADSCRLESFIQKHINNSGMNQ